MECPAADTSASCCGSASSRNSSASARASAHAPAHYLGVSQTGQRGEQLRRAPDLSRQFARASVDVLDGLRAAHEALGRAEHQLKGELLLGALRGIGQRAEQFQATVRVVGGFVVGAPLQRAPPGGLPDRGWPARSGRLRCSGVPAAPAGSRRSRESLIPMRRRCVGGVAGACSSAATGRPRPGSARA